MNGYLGIALTLVLLGLNAIFVGAEFALISARRTQLEPRVAAGSRTARWALKAMEQVTIVMAAAQLGITMCTLGLGAISEPAIAHLMEPVFELLAVPEGLVHPVSFVLATALVVWAHVVFGEMVPKNLSLVAPERAALTLGPVMLAVVWILRPFVVALNAVANAAVRLARIEPLDEVNTTYTHDEVAGLIDESRREGLLDDQEYDLVSGALEFRGSTVERVLIPMSDLTTVTVGSTPRQIEEACAETGFSRFPVVSVEGELVGYLHIKDALETDEDTPIAAKWIRTLPAVRVGSGLHDALRTMQARGAHMARVPDESGEVLGIVMLEDVLEELVGEITDIGRR